MKNYLYGALSEMTMLNGGNDIYYFDNLERFRYGSECAREVYGISVKDEELESFKYNVTFILTRGIEHCRIDINFRNFLIKIMQHYAKEPAFGLCLTLAIHKIIESQAIDSKELSLYRQLIDISEKYGVSVKLTQVLINGFYNYVTTEYNSKIIKAVYEFYERG